MVSFPNAKVNLGLHVLNKRADGYHNIESCFLPVSWCDILEVIESDDLKMTFSGLLIPGRPGDNLCLKAYHVVNQQNSIPPVHIHLHKVIPMGAGVGGGSADAAFTIRVLNDLFSLGISNEDMQKYASIVGSDCPFFINNKAAMAKGRGTDLKPVELDLEGKKIIVVNPGVHISTSEAYSNLTISEDRSLEIEEVIKSPMGNWKDLLQNDFEEYVFNKNPEIATLKDSLYKAGAIYASMTGSGASVYGIFENNIPSFDFPQQFSTWIGDL